MLKAIRSFLPLSESDTDSLFCRGHDTIRAPSMALVSLSPRSRVYLAG